MELPPPPDPDPGPEKRGLTRQERKAIEQADKLMRGLLPAMKKINQLTDVIDEEVDIHVVGRVMREKIAMLMWQGEFMQKILEHSNPSFAGMEIVKYLAGLHHMAVEVKEMTPDDAKRLGYL